MDSIVVKRPGEPATVESLGEDSYKKLSETVGGMIELVHVPALNCLGVDVWANEEGLYADDGKPLPISVVTHFQPICGPVVFTSNNAEGETTPLSEKQRDAALKWAEERDVKHFPDAKAPSLDEPSVWFF